MNLYNLIVTYNRSEDLRKTLGKLYKAKFDNIIVVDNASEDKTNIVIEYYKKFFKSFYLITLLKNKGGSGGFAAGIKKFLEISNPRDFILLQDDDSYPNFESKIAKQYILSDVVTFPVLDEDKTLHPMNIPGKIDFIKNPLILIRKKYKRRPKTLNDFKNFSSFDYCSFVGLLIKRTVVESIGIPSENFFIYSDDTYYTSTISKKGIKILASKPEHTFTHKSPRYSGTPLFKNKFVYYEIRNKLIYLREFSSYPFLFCSFWILKCLLNLNHKNFFNVYYGIVHGLLHDRIKYHPSRPIS